MFLFFKVLISTFLLILSFKCSVCGRGRRPEISSQSHGKCELIKVPFCQGIQYNETIMPNILGHKTQEEAGVAIQEFVTLERSQCSPYLKFFLCSVYLPVCTLLKTALPPCPTLCLSAKENCDLIMEKYGYQWPEILDCSKFKESDLCVGQNKSEFEHRNRWKKPSPKKEARLLYCPTFMRANIKYEYSLNVGEYYIKNCGMPCGQEGDLFGMPAGKKVVRLIICSVACVCFLSSFFTFLTFIIDTERFRYPERPIVFISACYCVIAVAYIVGFSIGDRASCTEFEEQYGGDEVISSLVTQGAKREGCTIIFVMLYFCILASCIWWVILTLTWFLAAGLKWGQEAVESKAQYFHLIAWAIPAVMTFILLGMGQVDGDTLTGVCYTGLTDATTAKTFVAGPLIALLSIGCFFLVAGFVSLCRVTRAMKHDGSRIDKLEKLMMRIGAFALLYVAPVAVVVGCVFYEHAWMGDWMKGWYHKMCSNLQTAGASWNDDIFAPIMNKINFQRQQWGCGDYSSRFSDYTRFKPDMTIFAIKHLMTLVVGVACGFWICSGKTGESWSRFLCRNQHNKRNQQQQQQNQQQQQQLQPTLL